MVSNLSHLHPPVQFVVLQDIDSGLEGVIAIHSTVLGPGAGGCRFWSYPNMEAARDDALRLAAGMSYKNALAELPFGGAKAVILRPEGDFDRAALFRAFGRAVEALRGRYVTAEDVGTDVRDMEEVASESRHVAGIRRSGDLAGGDPSPWTALGVFESMQTAARFVFGSDLKGLKVAVQGTGNVGASLCRHLADAGARLVIADPVSKRRDRLSAVLGAEVVGVDEIASVDADIFAPCALGGALNRHTAKVVRAKLVCGAANNQLATPDVADLLLQRGVTYAPDYVVNAGGIISVSAEYLGETEASVSARVEQIAPRVAAILERALVEGRSPASVADAMAEERIALAAKAAA